MSEPEELIIDGAHRATRLAQLAWRRYGPPSSRQWVRLSDVRLRLELFVAALTGTPAPIAASQPQAPASWLAKLARPSPPGRETRLLPGTDGRRVCLPPSLPVAGDSSEVLAVYRVLALEQAIRIVRGTTEPLAHLGDPLVRDWYLLAEAAAVDRWIAAHVQGLAGTLAALRAEALAHRPAAGKLSPAERALEAAVCAVLGGHAPEDACLAPDGSIDDSLSWARAIASRTRSEASRRSPAAALRSAASTWRRALAPRSATVTYRGLAPVWHWGVPVERPPELRASDRAVEEPAAHAPRPSRVAEMRRRPRPREAAEGEDDENAGTWVIRADDPQESVEDPLGLQRPADRDEHADPEDLGDSLSDLPEARVVRTPGRPREVLLSDDELARAVPPGHARPARAGFAYPEWDYRAKHYRVPGAVVREPQAPLGSDGWAIGALARHGRLVRRVRARFERLRPRHVRVGRQPDGSDLDIDACVTMAADVRAGGTVDHRLYVELRPARRELTVALLVDVSASTDSWVSGTRRVVEVEKEALLVVCEALDALGDPYGIFAFSGEGPEDVSVVPLKAFRERNGQAVRRRIAALESDRYTRIGAAMRHVTASICRQPSRRRLLLVLSDGKPNDVDVYEGRYGIEDARQAVAEARRQGVNVFCLTVDREAPRYAVRMFGPGGFAVLHRAEQLPAVLIEALRQLIRS